ncbi:MAG: hypothetical protein QMC79_07685 [Anaerosomatales bacterium]|nr:hypothetical protein [Anaerosomatales bacterium]
MRWVLPYIDEPPDFWERVAETVAPDPLLVYAPLPGDPLGTGRPPQPTAHLDELLDARTVPVAALVNPIVHEGPAERAFASLEPTLRHAVEQQGVAEAVLGSVGLARLVRAALPTLPLAASTLLEITAPVQLVYLEGVFDTITPGDRVMRDAVALRELRDGWSGRVRLMVNEGCLPGCVYRTQHFFEMNAGEPMPASLCAGLLEREPWLALTGAWVLPQHLELFDGLYDELKLDGRVTLADPGRYLRVLRAYVERTPLALGEIGGGPATAVSVPAVSRAFYVATLACDKSCATCDVCREYYASGGP